MGRRIRSLDPDGLTPIERRFVLAYHGSNGMSAAATAGYTGSPQGLKATASRLLRRPEVQAALARRPPPVSPELAAAIADRVEREKYLTTVMRSRYEKTTDRIRATELLGKGAGDYLERVEVSASESLLGLLAAARRR